MPKYLEISFSYKAQTDVFLDPIKGSAIRGAIGQVMKRKFCTCGGRFCRKPTVCNYGKLFETRNLDLEKPLYRMKITKPYAFYSEDKLRTDYSEGETIPFKALIFGKEASLLGSCVVACLPEVEAIGKKRKEGLGKIELESFETKSQEFPEIALGKELALEFLSPAIIQKNERILRNPNLKDICMACARKTQNMLQFHYGIEPKIDFELVGKYRTEPKFCSLKENSFTKWSAKKGKREQVFGMEGKIGFQLPEDQEYKNLFQRLLSISSVSGIGLRASHGFGRFRIVN